MVVEGVHGLDGAFPAGVRAVVESQLSRPWCAVPEIEPLVVRGRVRAGQVVRHDAGDVDVLASVMPGGEVIAGGSVRVVGALSGKVRAGCLNAVGPASQVLCGALQAQVVSIDGRYVTGDRMPPDLIGLPARVHVRDGRMRFDSVDPVTVSTVEERAMAGLPPGLASLAS
jgi:septum site-determining protein MinC